MSFDFDISRLRRKPGRPSKNAAAEYDIVCQEFSDALVEFSKGFDKTGSRGYAYLLEQHGLRKSEFDWMEGIITKLRVEAFLPLDFTAFDEKRKANGIQTRSHVDTPDDYAEWLAGTIFDDADYYTPNLFWDDKAFYIELITEKKDVVPLLTRIVEPFYIPVSNASGWSDNNQRGEMALRFKEHEAKGLTPVILYCGDLDPKGEQMSNFLRANFDKLKKQTGWKTENLIIDRFALNIDFITKHSLTWIDNLETGSKPKAGETKLPLDHPDHPDHKQPYVQEYLARYGARKCECNALVTVPEATEELVLRTIEKYIKLDSGDNYRAKLKVERDKVREALPDALKELLSR